MLTWPEVRRYITRVLRWWPLLAVAALLASGTAWYVLQREPEHYSARVTLLVGNNFTSSSPSRATVDLSNTMAEYYAEIIRREIVLEPVVKRLGLEFHWEHIRDFMLSSSINRSVNLLEITIVDTSPRRAAAIAAAIADQVVNISPNSPERRDVQRAAVDRQIAESQSLLSDLNQKIDALEQKQASLDSSIDVRNLSDQLEKLRAQRKDYQASYNQLILLRESEAANSLTIFEPAQVPSHPLPKKKRLTTAVAGLGGLIFAIFAVLIIERFDTRWRTPNDLQEQLGIRWLGQIAYGKPVAVSAEYQVGTVYRDIAEIYSNLLLSAKDQLPQVLLISSPYPNPLRSALTVDLANQCASSGNRVLIVDAEPSTTYVTDLLGTKSADPMIVLGSPPNPWDSDARRSYSNPADICPYLQPTFLNNVWLLPGPRRDQDKLPIPAPSLRWPEYVHALRQTADVVIFDGPSALMSADAALLAPQADGVVLVLEPTRDPRTQIIESQNRLLNNSGSRLLGAVVVFEERWGRGVLGRSGKGIAITVDRRGITISLPKGRSEPGQRPEPASRSAPGGPVATPERQESGLVHHASERSPTWEELVSMSHHQDNSSTSHTQPSRSSIITPPPANGTGPKGLEFP